MVKFKFHERDDIIDAIENHTLEFTNMRRAIWIVVLYFSKIAQSSDVFADTVKFIETYYIGFQYEAYMEAIDQCIKLAKKYTLKESAPIVIRKSEMEIIQSFNDMRKEKIAFVLIAIAKYFNSVNNTTSNHLYAKTCEIFRYARVSVPASERDYYYHFVYESGILVPHTSIGHNMQIVGVISDDHNDEVVMTLDEDDFKELAYAYLNFKQGGYKRCKMCGRLFKIQKSKPAKMYCHLCSATETVDLSYKEIKCVDCGDIFYAPMKNNRTRRCDSCQFEHHKSAKLAWQNKKREFEERSK